MADPKADCGGVDRRLAGRVVAFADELLAFADQVHPQLPAQRLLAMPGGVISVACSDPAYANLCDRSFLSSTCVGGERSPPRLAVFDHRYCASVPQWRYASPGLGNVTRALAKRGICGTFDPDFGIWQIYHPQRALAVQLMDFDHPPSSMGGVVSAEVAGPLDRAGSRARHNSRRHLRTRGRRCVPRRGRRRRQVRHFIVGHHERAKERWRRLRRRQMHGGQRRDAPRASVDETRSQRA